MHSLRGQLKMERRLHWRNALASAYTTRGNAKTFALDPKVHSALRDFDKAILMRESLRSTMGSKWPNSYCNELATTYMNRGIAKHHTPHFGSTAAIEDYNKAIVFREGLRAKLGEEWPIPWRNDLATAYSNRGVAKRSSIKFGPEAAIADYNKAVALMEELRDDLGAEWPQKWCNELAGVYMNRGNAKELVSGYEVVSWIEDHNSAIALREKLRTETGSAWPSRWRADLATSYFNRGEAKRFAPVFRLADVLCDIDATIEVLMDLRADSGENWPEQYEVRLQTSRSIRAQLVSSDSSSLR